MEVNYSTIVSDCKQFLRESDGVPLIKTLLTSGSAYRKVKVRNRKNITVIDKVFNLAYPDHNLLRQRCILAAGEHTTHGQALGLEQFFVFPIDGYKFLYNTNVNNSEREYAPVLSQLEYADEQNHSSASMVDVMIDSLGESYASTDLKSGLVTGCEIMIHGVSHYYAVRCSSVEQYSTLFSL